MNSVLKGDAAVLALLWKICVSYLVIMIINHIARHIGRFYEENIRTSLHWGDYIGLAFVLNVALNGNFGDF